MIRIVLLSTSIFFLLLTGCVSLSTLQTPKVVQEGEVIAGVGALAIPVDGDIRCCGVEAYIRFPYFKNSDIGIKAMGLPGFGIITGDLKYQLINDPIYLSLDLAYSYTAFEDLGSGSGIIPAVFIGTEKFFGGAKIIYSSIEVDDLFGSSSNSTNVKIPGIFVGGIIGDRFRLLPVINIYFSPDNGESIFIYNLGLEYKF